MIAALRKPHPAAVHVAIDALSSVRCSEIALFAECAVHDAVAARASLEFALAVAAVTVSHVCIVAFFTCFHRTVAATRHGNRLARRRAVLSNLPVELTEVAQLTGLQHAVAAECDEENRRLCG